MIKVAVSGCAGRMGSSVVEAVGAASDMEIACGIDPFGKDGAGFPVFHLRVRRDRALRFRCARRLHAARRRCG